MLVLTLINFFVYQTKYSLSKKDSKELISQFIPLPSQKSPITSLPLKTKYYT
jgi:hypothetical protein